MRVLCIEPFFGGSHRRFVETLFPRLRRSFDVEYTLLTLPARHWKWRMRGAVPFLFESKDCELRGDYDLVFTSSYVALAELVGLYPHLGAVPRVLYFHENQLAYPVQEAHSGERDRHFGFSQMTSALAATRCVFNSHYNMESFLSLGAEWLRSMPDARPTGWADRVRERSEVLGVPLDLPALDPDSLCNRAAARPEDRTAGPILLFNHRFEHDKNPAEFFHALVDLGSRSVPFRVVVCGQYSDEDTPEKTLWRRGFGDRVLHWGFVDDPREHRSLLQRCHLVVSTAAHEFFGLSVLEAVWLGARPVVPDRLAYPELYPEEFRYTDLESMLAPLCTEWTAGRIDLRADRRELFAEYAAERLIPRYHDLFQRLITSTSARPSTIG